MYTQNIKALRVVKGLTQEDLAKFLGISLNSYNNKENGKREFSLIEANSLAELFGYSIEEIFFKNEVFKMNTKL
ncbi:MAG: helix-turn-helix domain-containing protein [Serratia marcescens]|nr:helix-turn-helix domain-containing protein [Peptostreptococcaceae bacterium]MDU6304696.1 helix-turn-helix domain-containing protein [Serratia marcescens]